MLVAEYLKLNKLSHIIIKNPASLLLPNLSIRTQNSQLKLAVIE